MNVEGTIVVGVDGSSHASRALEWAARQAWLEHRTLSVVAAGDDARILVEDAVRSVQVHHAWLDVQAVPQTGDPRAVLLACAEDAHLLVVGSRGRGGVRSLLLGSVSSALATQAPCPVVVCRPGGGSHGQGVVVGADGTAASLPAVEMAYREASLLGEPLTVLHGFWDAAAAVAEYRSRTGGTAVEPDLEDLRALLAESVAGMAERYPDVKVDLVLRHGFVEEALAPRDGAWALVVVGRREGTSRTALLEASMSRVVVERAASPVLVVPQGWRGRR